MSETDALLARIDENVKYLRQSFDDHVIEYESVKRDYIKPLWEERLERKGSLRFGSFIYTFIMAAIAAAAGYAGGGGHK